MNSWLPFMVIGLTSGSVYAITGLGLVLSYRTSGIFNFGYGAVAAASAYFYFQLHARWGLPTWVAVAVVVFVAGPLTGVVFELVARGLSRVSVTAKIVATIGILLGVEAALSVIFGAQPKPFPSILPTSSYSLAGVRVGVDQTITVVLGVVSMFALYTYLRYSRTGVAMRAVVESPDLLGLTGTSPTVIRTTAWVIGSSFAAVAGLLLAPSTGLDPLDLILIVVQAFSAAAFGSFSSLPLTYSGGLLVGLVYAIAEKVVAGPGAHVHWLQGLPASTPFLVLFAVLVFAPVGRLRDVAAATARVQSKSERRPHGLRLAGTALTAVLGLSLPWMVGVRLPIYTNALCLAILFASLRLLVRTSGQISLAHFGFAAVGGAAMAHLSHGSHVPWLIALVLAGLLAVPIGIVLAIPAIRLSGLYLALATFGFGILLANLVYPIGAMFGQFGSLKVARPRLGFINGAEPKTFYFIVLTLAVMVIAAIVLLERSRLGRLLKGLADSPIALTVRGTNVNTTRVLVFGISAFIAAVAGALYASSVGYVSSTTYPWFNSLVIVAVLYTVGNGILRAPVLAALAYVVLPSYITSERLVEALPIVFGVSAILVAIGPLDSSRIKMRLSEMATRWADRSSSSPALDRIPELASMLVPVREATPTWKQ